MPARVFGVDGCGMLGRHRCAHLTASTTYQPSAICADNLGASSGRIACHRNRARSEHLQFGATGSVVDFDPELMDGGLMKSSLDATVGNRVSRRLVLRAALVTTLAAALTSCASGDDTAGSAEQSTAPTATTVLEATTAPDATTVPTSAISSALRLVAIGDSIPFNSPNDCVGCTGFVDQYAAALGKATGRAVQRPTCPSTMA